MACASLTSQLRAAPALPGRLGVGQRRVQRGSMHSCRAASGRDAASNAQESKNMLEAFFIGRALAETVNERAGAALGDALANFGTFDAEFRQAIREFQSEVMARAQQEMRAAAGASSSGNGSSGSSSGGSSTIGSAVGEAPDLPALVDELRAEVASARAVLQQLKQQQAQERGQAQQHSQR